MGTRLRQLVTAVVVLVVAGAAGVVPAAAGPAPPTVSIIVSAIEGSDGWYVSDPEVFLVGHDPDHEPYTCEYRVDGSAWIPYVASFLVAEGVHFLEARCTDADGNIGEIESMTAKVDLTQPTLSVDVVPPSPTGENNWYSSAGERPTMVIEAVDVLSGIDRCQFRADGGLPFVLEGSFADDGAWVSDPFILPDGAPILDLRCNDNAGWLSNERTLSVQVDMVGPTIDFVGNETSYSLDDVVSIDCVADDAISGLAEGCDDADIVAVPAYELVGAHLEATATDVAGNVTVATEPITVVVDGDGVQGVVDDLVEDPAVAAAINDKIEEIESAENDNAKAGKCQALLNQIAAKEGKSITTAEADTLRALIDHIC